MAAFAIATEFSTMDIVLPVAAGTCFPHANLVLDRITVTGAALQRLMSTVEAELTLRVVVKLPQIPTVRVMAAGAIITQALFMLIIALVAGDAVSLGILEGGSDMTALTGSDRVQADQREPSQVMLKLYQDSPAALVMTSFTVFTQLAAMGIIQLVTAVTIERQFLAISRAGMTFVASHLFVFVT